MYTNDSEIIPADDPIMATRYTDSGIQERPKLQQHNGAVENRKRIYSFSLKVSKIVHKVTIRLNYLASTCYLTPTT